MNQTKTKHSEAPWVAAPSGNIVAIAFPSKPNTRLVIADLRTSVTETEELISTRKADAKLIAAAPDLLFACKNALEYLNNNNQAFNDEITRDILAKAINKAEGE